VMTAAREFNAPGLVGKVLENGAARVVAQAGAAAGGSTFGPLGSAAAAGGLEGLISRIANGSTSRLDRVSNLIGSAPFREVIDRTTAGADPTSAINRLANSRQFNQFARGLGLDTQEARRSWIRGALTAGIADSEPTPETAPVALEIAQ